ncbi:hypothetical protein QM155_04910 [Enterobacter hormaechei]|uniref:hypothetical protein n=1 Tax=Enterobacter hormaechei TaxID=158836 RepID=UPI002949B060|nr:hypothetical protein [Enterobacter hormaechei]MDV5486547.1 hypothetical protein [Enterobacter hormaechei]MDV5520342.1 hypothetical protein [Enterobacter hormaechei]MDV5521893.1 hypothetical protein [Enterobacter hormaechei]MDV5535953.1 hypothetical protein [Enterobacter hormaechei]MDV5553089.1 hypothetical protein [Enterobacter hormaechei]
MTNVSAVEKMAELMQQMEENSPRVAAFQYCLKQVAEKVEEAEKRNAELESRCAALAAENALLKKSEPAPFSKLMMEALDVYQAGADEVPELAMLSAYKKLRDGLKTPATDAFLAEVRAEVIEWLETEISAIDTIYRGDPSYEHDAYWMKNEVLDVVESARNAFAAQSLSKSGVQS